MSNEKFTPGEWGVFGNKNMLKHYIVLNPQKEVKEQKIIADVFCCGGDVAANAYLIAAAPEMYRALDKCQSCIQHFLDGKWDNAVAGETENLLIEIEAVLKKARGEG